MMSGSESNRRIDAVAHRRPISRQVLFLGLELIRSCVFARNKYRHAKCDDGRLCPRPCAPNFTTRHSNDKGAWWCQTLRGRYRLGEPTETTLPNPLVSVHYNIPCRNPLTASSVCGAWLSCRRGPIEADGALSSQQRMCMRERPAFHYYLPSLLARSRRSSFSCDAAASILPACCHISSFIGRCHLLLPQQPMVDRIGRCMHQYLPPWVV